MPSERILAVGLVAVSGILLLRLGRRAVRSWRIYAVLSILLLVDSLQRP